jgi:hypothetical protein
MEDKIEKLLTSIKSKTEKNKAQWSEGSSDTQYTLNMSSGSIVVDKTSKVTGPPPDPEARAIPGFSVSILNDEGDVVEEVYSFADSDPKKFEFFEDLWKTIDRKYRKVDETLRGMIEEVDSKDTIGKKEETFEPDDELPF